MKRPLTKRNCSPRVRRANSGLPTKPVSWTTSVCSSTGTRRSSYFDPKTRTSRWRRLPAGKSKSSPPLWLRRKAHSGWAKAMRWNSSIACRNSTWSLFRKLRRAGTLKNRCLTTIRVPTSQATASDGWASPPSITCKTPSSSSARRVRSSTRAMLAMLARASPRKPIVARASRSSAERSLEVACRSKQSAASSGPMPIPLSSTAMRFRPASLSSTVIREAPASSAFSMSSFTTEAGRCTTSPAAI